MDRFGISFFDRFGLATEGVDYFRGKTYKKYSETGTDQRLLDFYRLFFIRYGDLITQFSRQNCVPPWLLASVILGERVNMDDSVGGKIGLDLVSEDSLESMGLGNSVGLAQIRANVAMDRGLTPTSADVKKEISDLGTKLMESQTTPELIDQVLTYSAQRRIQAEKTVRKELLNPYYNIRASAIYISQLLDEMGFKGCDCRKRQLWWPNPSFQIPKCLSAAISLSAYMGAAHNDNTIKPSFDDYSEDSGKGEGVYARSAFIQLIENKFISSWGSINKQ